jgi:predicted HicB family RNase H-like nuclease
VDVEAGILFGRVIGLRDVITFQGGTVEEARRSFQESVDFYLESCAADGDEPEKPYSGTIIIRTRPEVHRALALEAELRGESLNKLAEQALLQAIPPQAAAKSAAASRLKQTKPPGRGDADKRRAGSKL